MLAISVLQGFSCNQVHDPGHNDAGLNGELLDLYGTISVLFHKVADGLVQRTAGALGCPPTAKGEQPTLDGLSAIDVPGTREI